MPARPRTARFTPVPTTGRRIFAIGTAAVAVAALAFAVALLAFFVGNGQNPEVIAQLAGHFGVAAVLLAALLAVANAAGATRRWFLGGITALTSAVLAALLSTILTVSAGGPLNGNAFVFVVGSLVSVNLVFIITATLGQMLLAPRVLDGVLRYAPPAPARRLALVRIPASNLAEGELTHLERAPVDEALADRQWDNYCAALIAEGWDTLEVDAAPDLADSVFVEDAVVLFGDLAVLTRPGAESRRGEIAGVEATIEAIPGLSVRRIAEPGTLDGGDVLKVDDTVYVGASSRTNAEGIRQLRAILAPHGYRVIGVPVRGALHLKSAATALPDGSVIGDPELVDPAMFGEFLAVPERAGVAVVHLSDDTLLMSASAPKTAELVSGLGYRVVTVDISEFEKLEGCVTCLSVRVR
ncbi:dimethylarginine dimethylaminohydrolase [Agromyces archimandritae]|uniref:Dimethylarginine dimethylaminohydrolase n=2 Tax=Agromyces archimandritae TaxID=2781962 RepID=A0A975FRC6_9MICO|nr:dimethylarginine dimethylaminohydrolase [Agromyces archimandritae]